MKNPVKFVLLWCIAIVAVCIAVSCGSHKKTLNSQKETTVKIDENLIVEKDTTAIITLETETTRFGDTLQGNFPLPELTAIPLVVTVESGGQTLDLSITKSGVSYKAIPKHISTTKTKAVQQNSQQIKVAKAVTLKSTSNEAIVTESERKQWKFPLWLTVAILIVIVLVVTYFLTPLNRFLKPFKTFIK